MILERGDIAWIDFSPTKGHEQSGLRPAVIISPLQYNSFSNIVLVCPMTTKSKNHPFEVPVDGPDGKSFVLCDHVRSFDTIERVKRLAGKVSELEVQEILAKISTLFR